MAGRDEPTMAFSIWPNLLMVEGPAQIIGLLLTMLYDDPKIPRDGWVVDHGGTSRREYAATLKRAGTEVRRQGIAIKDQQTVELLLRRVQSLGLTFHTFAAP